ncbi:MAG: GTP 3',8-cyclase MoaA [Pseudomonadota bacterium]|nr:GTP 3',8-cyclase MoaA [Pseudomonadota bacterium]
MAERIIPVIDQRLVGTLPLIPSVLAAPTGGLFDLLHRPMHDLRISVTDRCNFRCSYCMPKEIFDKRFAFLPQSALLSFEEIARTARAFVAHGVRKIRLTGGEPLLRRDLERLVALLSQLRTVEGEPLDLTLTTNGSLLGRKAQALREAGLGRVTVSLDAIDDATFQRMNDADFSVAAVLDSIDAAERAGFGPIKVNMVVKRGSNDAEILPMVRHFRGRNVALRFIEFMDVGATNGWRMDDVLPSSEVLRRIADAFRIEPLPVHTVGETAERWRYAEPGVAGEIGTISSVTRAFCHDCNRARLSTEGKLFLCLFASQGHDIGGLLRSGASDAELSATIGSIWQGRTDRYSELRSQAGVAPISAQPRVEMHYIGG